LKPALAARSNRSRKSYSVNSIVRLAANFGMMPLPSLTILYF
jgi:hypothetical protein